MFNRLFHALGILIGHSQNVEEYWGGIDIRGIYYDSFGLNTLELNETLTALGFPSSLSVSIDGDRVTPNNIIGYNANSNWSLNINKLLFCDQKIGDCFYNFFYSKAEFINWAQKLNPFGPDCPLNKINPLKIIVNGLDDSFGGPHFLVTKNENEGFYMSNYNLPGEKEITQQVHFITPNSVSIVPDNHFITFGSLDNDCAKPFIRNSGIILSACLVDEYYSNDKIILRGVKRVQMKLSSSDPKIDLNFLAKLGKVVEWIYEDKTETRIKLLIDRLTLDLDYDKPYLDGLLFIIESAFQQAKERYNFVIIERKDNYLKELRELLKDVKGQSDLYSTKVRNLLSNLMRDVLAGFLLVGFSFFTKITEMTKLINQEALITLVFRGFSIYFLISAIIQSIVDISDLRISNKEMRYWKNVSREYIPDKEFSEHIKLSLSPRKNSIYVIYPIILFVYFLIATISWYFPCIWKTYISK